MTKQLRVLRRFPVAIINDTNRYSMGHIPRLCAAHRILYLHERSIFMYDSATAPFLRKANLFSVATLDHIPNREQLLKQVRGCAALRCQQNMVSGALALHNHLTISLIFFIFTGLVKTSLFFSSSRFLQKKRETLEIRQKMEIQNIIELLGLYMSATVVGRRDSTVIPVQKVQL